MADHRRARARLHAHQVVERDERAGLRPDVELADVARLIAVSGGGLRIDAVGARTEVEVIHILRPEIDTEGVADLLDGHADALGLLAIDRHLELGIVDAEGGEETAHPSAAHRCGG